MLEREEVLVGGEEKEMVEEGVRLGLLEVEGLEGLFGFCA